MLEMDIQGDQSITLLLDVYGQGSDLAFVNQKFSGASGLVVARAGLDVRGNIHTHKKKFTVAVDAREAFIKADLAVADALYLRAEQVHSGLEGVQDKIVVVGLAVDNPRKVFGLLGRFLACLSCHIPDRQTVSKNAMLPGSEAMILAGPGEFNELPAQPAQTGPTVAQKRESR